jgi:hypothetical protein
MKTTPTGVPPATPPRRGIKAKYGITGNSPPWRGADEVSGVVFSLVLL